MNAVLEELRWKIGQLQSECRCIKNDQPLADQFLNEFFEGKISQMEAEIKYLQKILGMLEEI